MKMSRIVMKTRIFVGNVRWRREEKKETRRERWGFKYLGLGANEFTSPDEVNFLSISQHGTHDLFLSIVFLGIRPPDIDNTPPENYSVYDVTITWLSIFAHQHLPRQQTISVK